MAEVVMRAPTFEALLRSESNLASNTVDLTFRSKDQKHYLVQLERACGATVGPAISIHLAELQSRRPEKDLPAGPMIPTTSIQGAMNSTGQLALVVSVAGGSEMTFEFPPGPSDSLADLFEELALMMRPRQ